MDELPVEVTTEILSRIPMRYVLRCRCVCKTWKKMIDGHSFPPTFLFFPDNYHAFYLAEESETTKIEYTGPNPGNDLLLFTPPCNGFLGLTFKGSDKFGENGIIYTYIYNPITQQCIKLPDLSNPFIQDSPVPILGLGLDLATNNFKVVHLLRRRRGIRAGPRRQALVFTLGGSDSWRKLHNFPKIACFGLSVFVNGSLYWLTKDGRILSFDLTTELFSFIEIPQFRPLNLGPSVLGLGLVDLGGRLSVFDPFINEGDIEVWIMKDYKVNQSWSKLMIMKSYLERSGFPSKAVLPINSWKYGEILLYYESDILVSYEIETGKCTHQIKSEDGLWNDEYDFFPYVGNLMRIMPPRQLAE